MCTLSTASLALLPCMKLVAPVNVMLPSLFWKSAVGLSSTKLFNEAFAVVVVPLNELGTVKVLLSTFVTVNVPCAFESPILLMVIVSPLINL